MSANLGDRTVATGLLIPTAKKDSTKEWVNHQTIALVSHASKVIFKILHARLQHYMKQELPDSQAGLEKEKEPEIKLPPSVGS